jgi:recombinational DNA repair protein (RecF pathway)
MVPNKKITSSDASFFGALTDQHKDQTTPRTIVAPALSVSRAASQKYIRQCVQARCSRKSPLTHKRGGWQARQFLQSLRSRIRPSQRLKKSQPPALEVFVSCHLASLGKSQKISDLKFSGWTSSDFIN